MNTLSIQQISNFKLSEKQKFMLIVALLFPVLVVASPPSAGDFLFGVYTELMSWLTGAPGIIISLATFGVAAFQGIMRQNYLAAGGAFLIALLFANAQEAIEYFLTAGVAI